MTIVCGLGTNTQPLGAHTWPPICHMTLSFHARPAPFGYFLFFIHMWVFLPIVWPILGVFGDFWPFEGDIGPFLMPNLGGKLGDGYQL
jgi:hypothetical protein